MTREEKLKQRLHEAEGLAHFWQNRYELKREQAHELGVEIERLRDAEAERDAVVRAAVRVEDENARLRRERVVLRKALDELAAPTSAGGQDLAYSLTGTASEDYMRRRSIARAALSAAHPETEAPDA